MISRQKKLVILVLTGLFSISHLHYCIAQNKKFTFSEVYPRGESKILDKVPDIEGWLDDNSYLVWEAVNGYKKAILQSIDVKTGEIKIQSDFTEVNKRFDKGRLLVPWEAHNKDYSKYVIKYQDDLYYFYALNGSIKQLTNSEVEEKNPTISPDGLDIAFTKDNDLYIINIESGEERRLTHDGADLIKNGFASWVYYEEILGRRSKYKAFWWSPDNKMIAFLRFDDSIVPQFPIFQNEGIHGNLNLQRYPKAGDSNPTVKLGLIHLENNHIQWIDSTEEADNYIAWIFWTKDSKYLLYQKLNRGQDKIQIIKAEPFSDSKKQIYEEVQPSWIDFFKDLYVLKNENGFLLRSDKSGWRHIYHFNLEGKLLRQITEGDWNINKIVQVNEDNKEIFFEGFNDKSVENHLFIINLDGSGIAKLTRKDGMHSTKVSSRGTYFIDTYSNTRHPQKIILSNKRGNRIRILGDKNSQSLQDYKLGQTEIFTVPTDDGLELPALWVLPPNFDKSKKYPVIFQVYGGPGSANVRNQFRSLSNQYLAQHDIIIFSVDHRGSYHFGKTGQSRMHRNLGKWEMNDYIQAAKWLQTLPFVDQDRIGIIGGSYGGYVSAMALTYGAEYFTHGISLYPVTDWRLYDTVYTERYMDTPAENPEGYKFGSVLTYAHKLVGKLLLIHGAIDDNVHMQHTLQLTEDLQKFDKSFELMIYPNQKHGIRGLWRTHNRRETIDFWFRHFFGQKLEDTQTEN